MGKFREEKLKIVQIGAQISHNFTIHSILGGIYPTWQLPSPYMPPAYDPYAQSPYGWPAVNNNNYRYPYPYNYYPPYPSYPNPQANNNRGPLEVQGESYKTIYTKLSCFSIYFAQIIAPFLFNFQSHPCLDLIGDLSLSLMRSFTNLLSNPNTASNSNPAMSAPGSSIAPLNRQPYLPPFTPPDLNGFSNPNGPYSASLPRSNNNNYGNNNAYGGQYGGGNPGVYGVGSSPYASGFPFPPSPPLPYPPGKSQSEFGKLLLLHI
jgi:hypothetical protein